MNNILRFCRYIVVTNLILSCNSDKNFENSSINTSKPDTCSKIKEYLSDLINEADTLSAYPYSCKVNDINDKGLEINFDELKCIKFNNTVENTIDEYKYYILKSICKSDSFKVILVLRYFIEESCIWIISINSTTEVFKALEIAYANSEGSYSVYSILYKDSIKVISTNEFSSTSIKEYYIRNAGEFIIKKDKTD